MHKPHSHANHTATTNFRAKTILFQLGTILKERGDWMNKAFESQSSEMWHFVADASELSATSIFRTSATLLTDHTVSHLNNHHHELLKFHEHQFQDCSKALGIIVILFFGVNAFPCATGYPQGHNFLWHTIWTNIVWRYRWWRGKRRQIHTNLPSPNPFSVLVTFKHNVRIHEQSQHCAICFT
jgi:hypothetical protein